jgi:HEAT repeat protein
MLPITVLALLSAVAVAAADGSQPAPPPWDVIDRGLQSHDFEHRRQTLAALGTIPGSSAEAVRRVENALLHDGDGRVRREAALALGRMGASSSIPALRQALDDHGEVAFAAAKSLTDLGDSSGRDTLIAVVAGKRSTSPGMMTNMVREAQHRVKHPEELLLMGAENAAGTMFAPAAMGMAAIEQTAHLRTSGSPARASAVAYLAKDPDPYAVTLLEWALQDDSKLVRLEAAKGLGARGSADSIGKLEPLLQDDHNAVRTMAAAAIIRLRDPARATTAQSTPATPKR